MIEKTFLDRVPTYPGRVKMMPVSGQANTYDMVRADNPTVEGTPIDKAAYDSIIQSRLTGRYYAPMFSRVNAGTTTATVNPIPTSGWTNESATYAKNGNYIATASGSEDNSISPSFAFYGTASTAGGWRAADNSATPWIAIDLGEPVRVTRVKTYFTATYDSVTCTLQGSNDNSTWTDLSTKTGRQTAATSWSFSNSVAYRYYRLQFGNGADVGVNLWEITSYTVSTYRNEFAISAGWPKVWTNGQIALVEIPASVNTLGVVTNTINGVTIDTLLQPSRRYELRYTGSSFAAKEV